jgi:hypothetical protein
MADVTYRNATRIHRMTADDAAVNSATVSSSMERGQTDRIALSIDPRRVNPAFVGTPG